MSKEIDRLLAGLSGDPSKPTKPLNLLAKLLRKIWADRAMTPMKWSQMLDRYTANPYNGVRQNPTSIASARSNLMREMKREKITYDVFVKGIRMADPLAATFSVTLKWDDGTTTIHEIEMPMRGQADDDEEDTDENLPSPHRQVVAPIPRRTREEAQRRREELLQLMDDGPLGGSE